MSMKPGFSNSSLCVRTMRQKSSVRRATRQSWVMRWWVWRSRRVWGWDWGWEVDMVFVLVGWSFDRGGGGDV